MPLTALHRFGEGDLNPNEQIIYRARLHFIAFLRNSKTGLFLVLIGILVLWGSYAIRGTIGFLIDDGVTLGVFIFAGFPLLYGLGLFAVRFVDWLYDEDIVTSQRVVDYNQKFIFSRDLTTANLKEIQNIILQQDGILRALFDFGNLVIQTAASGRHVGSGSSEHLLVEDIAHPKKVQRLIDEVSYRVKHHIRIDRDELLKICGLPVPRLGEFEALLKRFAERLRKLLE